MSVFKPADYYPGFRDQDLDMDGAEVLNAADPTAAQSLATMNYVDTEIAARIQIATVSLTAAEIKTLNASPKELIAAPGAGVSLVVERAVFRFNWGTTQYANGSALSVIYAGGSTNLLAATLAATFLTSPTGAVTNDSAIGPSASALTVPQNTAVQLKAATTEFATGDSTVDVTIWYRTV